jgi:hypothetical protein
MFSARIVIVPPVGYCIAGIDAQVEQDLVQLRRIRLEYPQVVDELDVDRDVLRERVLDDLDQVGDEVGDLHGHPLPLHAAGEAEHLADHLCAAPGAGLQRVQDLCGPSGRIGEPEQVGRHHDGRKHVVEVVRDASRQRADALQPLGPQELLLEQLAFGEVGVDGQNRSGFTRIAADE